jgi:putative FmdB family regulatory protein
MPTYEYECRSCGHSFDVFQSMRDEPLKICPECGKEVRRLINGGTGVIFKGGGFYVTDKSGKSDKSSGTAAGSSKTTENKTAGTEGGSCPGCAKAESCPKAVNS